MASFGLGDRSGTQSLFRRRDRRLGLSFYLILSVILFVISALDHPVTNLVKKEASDFMAPVMIALTKPMDWGADALDWFDGVTSIYQENQRLKEENKRLQEWRVVAERLDIENQRMQTLLNVDAPPVETLVTARIISATGGAYVRSVLVNAGSRQKVRENLPVTDGFGVVGRTILVGDQSSRILMATDINSRIPVRLERSGQNAIAIGTNGDLLEISFLPLDADAAVGDRILTSGDGGIFPPDLSVGIIVSVDSDRIMVEPTANLDRLNFVRILDYYASEPVLEDLPQSSSEEEG